MTTDFMKPTQKHVFRCRYAGLGVLAQFLKEKEFWTAQPIQGTLLALRIAVQAEICNTTTSAYSDEYNNPVSLNYTMRYLKQDIEVLMGKFVSTLATTGLGYNFCNAI